MHPQNLSRYFWSKPLNKYSIKDDAMRQTARQASKVSWAWKATDQHFQWSR